MLYMLLEDNWINTLMNLMKIISLRTSQLRTGPKTINTYLWCDKDWGRVPAGALGPDGSGRCLCCGRTVCSRTKFPLTSLMVNHTFLGDTSEQELQDGAGTAALLTCVVTVWHRPAQTPIWGEVKTPDYFICSGIFYSWKIENKCSVFLETV